MTSPPFPPYIVDIAVVMRDTENHHDDAIRTARKHVANALMVLNRELTRYGSPAAPAGAPAPAPTLGVRIPPPIGNGKLRPHHADVISAYLAGDTPVAIAEQYGVTDVTVRKYLLKHGIPLRTPRESALNYRNRVTSPTGATA